MSLGSGEKVHFDDFQIELYFNVAEGTLQCTGFMRPLDEHSTNDDQVKNKAVYSNS